MTLTFELDLDTVKTTQQAVYLGHKSFRSKVIARTDRQTDTHTEPIALQGARKWSVIDAISNEMQSVLCPLNTELECTFSLDGCTYS